MKTLPEVQQIKSLNQLQRKPRVGDRIGFGEFCGSGNGDIAPVREPTKPTFTVTRIDDNLCWIRPDGAPDEPRFSSPFIWNFSNGLNRLARIFE